MLWLPMIPTFPLPQFHCDQICKDFVTCAKSLSWLHLKHTVSPCADWGTDKGRILWLMWEAFHRQPNVNAWGHMKCMKRSLLQRWLQYLFWPRKLYMVVIFYWLKSYFCFSCTWTFATNGSRHSLISSPFNLLMHVICIRNHSSVIDIAARL